MEPTTNFAETIRKIAEKATTPFEINGLWYYRDSQGDMVLIEDASEKPVQQEFRNVLYEFDDYLESLNELSLTVAKNFMALHVCFLNGHSPTFQTVLDFANRENPESPGWKKMRVDLKPAASRQFNIWRENDLKWLGQVDFGDFIEVNILDVQGSEAAKLLDVARNLEANISSKFQSTIRPVSGDMKLRWESDTNTGECNVPQEFAVVIPLYQYGANYKLRCALQYRVREGAAQFRYRIVNLDAAVEDCFEEWRGKLIDASFPHRRGSI